MMRALAPEGQRSALVTAFMKHALVFNSSIRDDFAACFRGFRQAQLSPRRARRYTKDNEKTAALQHLGALRGSLTEGCAYWVWLAEGRRNKRPRSSLALVVAARSRSAREIFSVR
jgi:hypothetical protein